MIRDIITAAWTFDQSQYPLPLQPVLLMHKFLDCPDRWPLDRPISNVNKAPTNMETIPIKLETRLKRERMNIKAACTEDSLMNCGLG